VLFSHFTKHCKVQWKASETTLPIIVVSKLKIPDRSSQIVLQFFINKKESQKKEEAYIRRYDDDLWTPPCVLWEEKLPTAEIAVDHDETQTTEHRKQQVKERLGGSLPMLCCHYTAAAAAIDITVVLLQRSAFAPLATKRLHFRQRRRSHFPSSENPNKVEEKLFVTRKNSVILVAFNL
jgi:hypothetical protein